VKADLRPLAGRAIGAGEKHQRAGREALAFDPGVELVALDHLGHALAFAQPPAGRMKQEGADARRRADGLVDRCGGAVVDAAGERHHAAVVAQRYLEAFGRLLALGDGPVLPQVRAHLAQLAHRRDRADAEREQGEQRPDDLRAVEKAAQRRHGGAEHRPQPHCHDHRLEAQHRDRDRTHRAAVAELAEDPGAECGQAPGQQDGVQPVGTGERILADQVAPEKTGACLRARAPARLFPPRPHIRSISEEVTDQWVVTSP
jgi:hypothetical protein